jgi:hypothetical protein
MCPGSLGLSQGNWSLAKRDMERDIIPMCRAFGMAVGASIDSIPQLTSRFLAAGFLPVCPRTSTRLLSSHPPLSSPTKPARLHRLSLLTPQPHCNCHSLHLQFVSFRTTIDPGSGAWQGTREARWLRANPSTAPWGVMGGGKFKDPDEIKARKEAGTLRSGTEPTEDDIKVSQALKEVALEIGGEIHLASSEWRGRRTWFDPVQFSAGSAHGNFARALTISF